MSHMAHINELRQRSDTHQVPVNCRPTVHESCHTCHKWMSHGASKLHIGYQRIEDTVTHSLWVMSHMSRHITVTYQLRIGYLRIEDIVGPQFLQARANSLNVALHRRCLRFGDCSQNWCRKKWRERTKKLEFSFVALLALWGLLS